ncbi:hypothetical protein D3C72_1505290 [compost metagenome]
MEVAVEVAVVRRGPREGPSHALLVRLQFRERCARHGRQHDVVVGQVDGKTVEAVGNCRARRAAGLVVGPEHEVVDEQLRAPFEQLGQRGAAFVGFEAVRFVDPQPWQVLALLRQFVAAPRQCFFRLQQLEPGGQPVFARGGCVCGHRGFLRECGAVCDTPRGRVVLC